MKLFTHLTTHPIPERPYRTTLFFALSLAAVLLLSGCSILTGLIPGRSEVEEPTPTVERVLVPTFTPTTEGQADAASAAVAAAADATAAPAEEAAAEDTAAEAPAEPTATPEPAEPTPEPTLEPTATETPASQPRLVVNSPANVRGGPSTAYGIVGAANPGDSFDLVGKNETGDWWQFCCVNGQQGWIFGQLATVENAEAVAIAQNIPAPPPTQPPAPAPAEPAPAEPAPAEPAPAEPAPAASDPCANIGGDGCKFHVRNGPKFGENGGQELKLQLAFIHSGVEGGQAQGSYFVVLEKDGAKLPIGDNVRSIALDKRNGPLGQYNYEYSLGVSSLPGNTVAGNYTMWVLDGNGERDSQNFTFSVPDGQGLVWIEWDQG